MDPRFLPHNTHLENPDTFVQTAPHFKALSRQPLVHRSYLLELLPTTETGIYSLSGGRQIGKTTLMKQWMARLLELSLPIFIFHAVNSWLFPTKDPFNDLVTPLLKDRDKISKLVESCAVSQYKRYYPTFYIKAKGEVDIAYIHENRFWPVEIKWTGQLRPKQLSQINKYDNGLILTRSNENSIVQGIPAMPLPLALLKLGERI